MLCENPFKPSGCYRGEDHHAEGTSLKNAVACYELSSVTAVKLKEPAALTVEALKST